MPPPNGPCGRPGQQPHSRQLPEGIPEAPIFDGELRHRVLPCTGLCCVGRPGLTSREPLGGWGGARHGRPRSCSSQPPAHPSTCHTPAARDRSGPIPRSTCLTVICIETRDAINQRGSEAQPQASWHPRSGGRPSRSSAWPPPPAPARPSATSRAGLISQSSGSVTDRRHTVLTGQSQAGAALQAEGKGRPQPASCCSPKPVLAAACRTRD